MRLEWFVVSLVAALLASFNAGFVLRSFAHLSKVRTRLESFVTITGLFLVLLTSGWPLWPIILVLPSGALGYLLASRYNAGAKFPTFDAMALYLTSAFMLSPALTIFSIAAMEFPPNPIAVVLMVGGLVQTYRFSVLVDKMMANLASYNSHPIWRYYAIAVFGSGAFFWGLMESILALW